MVTSIIIGMTVTMIIIVRVVMIFRAPFRFGVMMMVILKEATNY